MAVRWTAAAARRGSGGPRLAKRVARRRNGLMTGETVLGAAVLGAVVLGTVVLGAAVPRLGAVVRGGTVRGGTVRGGTVLGGPMRDPQARAEADSGGGAGGCHRMSVTNQPATGPAA
jgi:hypothetical protein